MVWTPEVQGVPPLLPANGIGSMPADIEEHVDVTVLAPGDDNGLSADPACTVVAWVRDLALMSDVDPRLLKDLAHFLLVEQRVRVHACVHAEVRDLLLHQISPSPLCRPQCCKHGQAPPKLSVRSHNAAFTRPAHLTARRGVSSPG